MTGTLTRRFVDDPVFRNFKNVSIGFDRLVENLFGAPEPGGYPPYNIIQTAAGRYEIEVALAGFRKEDILLSFENGFLTISRSDKANPNVENATARSETSTDGKASAASSITYIHRGISKRNFVLSFRIAEQVELENAKMEDGVLTIRLFEKVEKSSPKYIEIE